MYGKTKWFLLAVVLCATALLLAACLDGREEKQTLTAPEAQSEFSVTVLDVGKADAMILKTENHTVLVDTGNRGDGKTILEELSSLGVSEVDYLFLTHFDEDHAGGAVKLLNNLSIGEVVVPKYKGTSKAYTRWLDAMEDNGKKAYVLTSTLSFVLDDVLFEVYPPLKNSYKESDNDYSLVLRVTHGDNTFLFTGDAEEERLRELPKQMATLESTVLKVPHHGRLEKNSADFFQSVSPAYAVITCGEDEPCDREVVDLLESLGTKVFQTKDGTVRFSSDGTTLDAVQEKNSSL